MSIDFDGLARQALAAHAILLPHWIGGKRSGGEWVGEKRINGGIGDSWSINVKSGKWRHFAGEETGSDIISFYAEIFHVTMGAAAREIARQLGTDLNGSPPAGVRALPYQPEEEPEPDCEIIPPDAGPIKTHPRNGEPTYVHRYSDFMIVQRWDLPSGKQFSPWTWREGAWVNKAWPSPRPLYHLEYLAKYPDATVMVVEGEKCADQASPLLEDYVVVSWYGGAQAWRHTDWEPLRGRSVLLWPDADDAGRRATAQIAAHLHSIASTVQVVNPNGAADGWDIGDAIGEGWKEPEIRAFVEGHTADPVKAPVPETRIVSDEPKPFAPLASAPVSWAAMGLDCDGNSKPYVTLSNASKALQTCDDFKGRIFFDEFRGQVYHTLRGPPAQPWTDRDTRGMTVAVQQQLKLHKFSMELIRHAITHAAECNSRNSLLEHLNSLVWDGKERLNTWLFDCAGVEVTDYTTAIARNWPIAMVARGYRPGCKMDNIPVLEGLSGLNKTRFLETLGGEWYEALPMEFGTKDFLHALQGVWLAEIPDMTGFDKADHARVIALLSTPRDKFRKSYGHEPERFKRTTVFAATSETDDYLQERRGKRRFWPLRCKSIDIDLLAHQRDQIFAEAIQCYREGEHWYDVPASARAEQDARVFSDAWTPKILERAEWLWSRQLKGLEDCTTSRIMEALDLPPHQQTRREVIRVNDILKAHDWIPKRDGYHWFWKKIER